MIKSYTLCAHETPDVEHNFSLTRSSCPESIINQIVKTKYMKYHHLIVDKLCEKACQNQYKCQTLLQTDSKRDTSTAGNHLILR